MNNILWDPAMNQPREDELPQIRAEYIKLKEHTPNTDGYGFLHGVAIIRHKGAFYTSWAANKGLENTPTEVVLGRHSIDGCKTWSGVYTIASGDSYGVSHGAYLSHGGKLYLYLPHIVEKYRSIQMYTYMLDESGGSWICLGRAAETPFWPLCEPVRLDDGNYIMAGAHVDITPADTNAPSAVAISRGADVTNWDVVKIPSPEGINIWGESTLILRNNALINISRNSWQNSIALKSISYDGGHTWTRQIFSNLEMTTAKPYAGTLSDGRHYLIGTTTADCGNARYPLTIGVSEKGSEYFTKVYSIRRRGQDEAKNFSYPYAIEDEHKLYVVYSAGTGGNDTNGAELAIISMDDIP